MYNCIVQLVYASVTQHFIVYVYIRMKYVGLISWNILVVQLAAVAALCVQYEAEFRPNMSIVVKALQPLLKTTVPYPPPTETWVPISWVARSAYFVWIARFRSIFSVIVLSSSMIYPFLHFLFSLDTRHSLVPMVLFLLSVVICYKVMTYDMWLTILWNKRTTLSVLKHDRIEWSLFFQLFGLSGWWYWVSLREHVL